MTQTIEKTTTTTPKWRSITIHADATLARALQDRTGDGVPNRTAKEMLMRAISILPIELSTLDEMFTLDEIKGIFYAVRGEDIEPAFVWKVVDFYLIDVNTPLPTIHEEEFIEKLKALTPAQSWALVDLAERFWAQNTGDLDARTLRRLGLVVRTNTGE